jgi:hypothetical protein
LIDGQKEVSPIRHSILKCRFLHSLLLFMVALHVTGLAVAADDSQGIRIQGSGVPPHLGFACCDHGIEEAQTLFANPAVISALQNLHAEVAVAILDFSPQRADIVRRLNQQGIPVVAWIMLSKEQGYYLNADNAPEAVARISDFDQWTRSQDLQWAAVGLDVEPNFSQLIELRSHRWQLATTLLGRILDGGRILRAQKAYSTLIRQIQSRGYRIQIYEMPYVPAERSVHSSLPDRLLGTVNVHGDEDYLMLYTSYARAIGAGMIWSLGPHAQSIGIGSTEGNAAAGSGSGPLDWTEFSRDLIVASHFTTRIGVYDLEGCVRQGFLPRLKAMDWGQSVVIPAASIRRAERLGFVARCVLWLASNSPWLLALGLLLIAWIMWRRRNRNRLSAS